MTTSFSRRIVLAFALLLLGFGVLVAFLGHRVTIRHEQETLQRLSHGLARHIVEHWPQVAQPADGAIDRASLDDVLHMLMVVNPAIEVYVLDSGAQVRSYLGEPGAVRVPQVDMVAMEAFLSGAPLPLLGSDPKAPGAPKIFSVAPFPRRADGSTPGYLYVVLNGEARTRIAAGIGTNRVWQTTLLIGVAGLLVTLGIGLMTFHTLTRPLRRVAGRMRTFDLDDSGATTPTPVGNPPRDEVRAIEDSFDAMAERISTQARVQAEQQGAHREIIANVAHDLRTPLTALHGYLETLSRDDPILPAGERRRYFGAALAQSDKVRRLSQQLFELARLQSASEVMQRDHFRLDELVHDTVQKFELSAQPPPVTLSGPPPGQVEMEGDLQLIDRALTNLIDNAVRHGPGARPVRVSLLCRGRGATVLVEDSGPGLPGEIARRLDNGQPVREPPPERPGGGFGGLGLAIAQRIAWLHGGSLRTLPSPCGGTRLCLALPLIAKARGREASA